MKNFDLEAAKRGAAVCTRGGCKARMACVFADALIEELDRRNTK